MGCFVFLVMMGVLGVVVGVGLVSIIDELVCVFRTSAEPTCGLDKTRHFLREEACFKRNHSVANGNPQIKSPQRPTLILRIWEPQCHLLCLCNIVSFSMFSCSHFSPINNPKTTSKRQMQEATTGEEERLFAKPMMSVASKTANQSSTSASNSPGTLKTQFEFRPYHNGETRCQRFERKRSIHFSSVALGCKHDHQYRGHVWGKQQRKLFVRRFHVDHDIRCGTQLLE